MICPYCNTRFLLDKVNAKTCGHAECQIAHHNKLQVKLRKERGKIYEYRRKVKRAREYATIGHNAYP